MCILQTSRWLDTDLWTLSELSAYLSTLTVKVGAWKWPSLLILVHLSLNNYACLLNRKKKKSIFRYLWRCLLSSMTKWDRWPVSAMYVSYIGNISSYTLIQGFNKDSYTDFELFHLKPLSGAKFLLIHNFNRRLVIWEFVIISCH